MLKGTTTSCGTPGPNPLDKKEAALGVALDDEAAEQSDPPTETFTIAAAVATLARGKAGGLGSCEEAGTWEVVGFTPSFLTSPASKLVAASVTGTPTEKWPT